MYYSFGRFGDCIRGLLIRYFFGFTNVEYYHVCFDGLS